MTAATLSHTLVTSQQQLPVSSSSLAAISSDSPTPTGGVASKAIAAAKTDDRESYCELKNRCMCEFKYPWTIYICRRF